MIRSCSCFALALLLSLAGCGDDDGSTVDAARPLDAGASDAGALDASSSDAGLDAAAVIEEDASEALDASELIDASEPLDASDEDAGSIDPGTDAGTTDSGTDAGTTDSGTDAGAACHEHGFGFDPVAFRRVSSLPLMTGGTIPLGTYDAIDVQTTTTVTGTYRGTWVFEDESTLLQLQQLTLSAPGPVVPRRYTYTAIDALLERFETCPGNEVLSTGYTVREQNGVYVLDVAQGALMISLRRR